MIYVTVGTQLPFDRLICAIDEWCVHHPEVRIFGQIAAAKFYPRNFEFKKFLSPAEAEYHFADAELIISHAGMGSILTAIDYKKSILIVPRKACLGEHRNDHQIATAKRMAARPGIFVAAETEDLTRFLDCRAELMQGQQSDSRADQQFISRLQSYIGNLQSSMAAGQ